MSLISKMTSFVREVQTEVKKVNWPTKHETLMNAALVVIFTVVVAIILGFFDVILARILSDYIL